MNRSTKKLKKKLKKIHVETNENECTIVQKLSDGTKAVLRKFYGNTSLPEVARKISIKHLSLHLKIIQKEPQMKPKAKRRRQIIRSRTKTKQKINKIRQKQNKTQIIQKLKRIK